MRELSSDGYRPFLTGAFGLGILASVFLATVFFRSGNVEAALAASTTAAYALVGLLMLWRDD